MADQKPASTKPVEIAEPSRKPRAKAPKNETKADKFRRLATFRVSKAIKILSSIGFLSNKQQYEYTDEQINRIITAVNEGARDMAGRLRGGTVAENGFKL